MRPPRVEHLLDHPVELTASDVRPQPGQLTAEHDEADPIVPVEVRGRRRDRTPHRDVEAAVSGAADITERVQHDDHIAGTFGGGAVRLQHSPARGGSPVDASRAITRSVLTDVDELDTLTHRPADVVTDPVGQPTWRAQQ